MGGRRLDPWSTTIDRYKVSAKLGVGNARRAV
jgi:hypothetical protein